MKGISESILPAVFITALLAFPWPSAARNFPVEFEANVGQADSQVKFLTRETRNIVFLTATQAVWRFGGGQSAALAMSLDGANPSPRIEGLDRLPAKSNYFHGKDPRQWRIGVPHYGKVRYSEVYPGVDLLYHGAPDHGGLEYDFVVAPGADPESIRLVFQGEKKMRVDSSGDLVIETGAGEIRQHKPLAYQEENGRRELVDVRYKRGGSGRIKLVVGSYDRRQILTIDPIVSYSTVFGATGDVHGIAIDSAGDAYVTGSSGDSTFPVMNPALPIKQPSDDDVFIAKLNTTGSALVYSTFVGGSDYDRGFGIGVDSSGKAYVTGYTMSTDFPTMNPFQKANAGREDAFIVVLNAAGSALLYSTYFGGTNDDEGHGIAVDGSGNISITGQTETNDPDVTQSSDNFPLAG